MPPRTPPPPLDPDRLHGWKEISAFVGKGLRTVQRWEKQYGLPVRRLGEGSDIVFASRREIEEWLRRSSTRRAKDEPPEVEPENGANGGAANGGGANGGAANGGAANGGAASGSVQTTATAVGTSAVDAVAGDASAGSAGAEVAPAVGLLRVAARRRAVVGVLAAVLVAAAAAGLWWVAVTRAPGRAEPPPQPATWRVEDDTLHVLDADGVLLWKHRISGPVADDRYDQRDRDWGEAVAIEDLDGDGRREVILRVISDERHLASILRCLNADGSVRWSRRLDDRMRFGDDTYSAPWPANHVRVLPNDDGTRSVWAVFTHGVWFPSVLEQIDAQGHVRSRYWSNGYIESVSPATWKGRPVLLVGAANNEHKASSLAILPREDATATAPSANPEYRCSTCPAREPLAFLVFPPNPLGRLRNETAAVIKAWVTGDDGLHVQVVEPPFDTPLDEGLVYYTLDPDLRPNAVEASVGYERLHEWWRKAGRLDRPFTADETKRMVPILKWNGVEYTPLGMASR